MIENIKEIVYMSEIYLKDLNPGEWFVVMNYVLKKTNRVGVGYKAICTDAEGKEHEVRQDIKVRRVKV